VKSSPEAVKPSAEGTDDLDQNQLARLAYLVKRYNEALKEYNKRVLVMTTTYQQVSNTVGNYYSIIQDEPDIVRALKLLRDRVKPSHRHNSKKLQNRLLQIQINRLIKRWKDIQERKQQSARAAEDEGSKMAASPSPGSAANWGSSCDRISPITAIKPIRPISARASSLSS